MNTSRNRTADMIKKLAMFLLLGFTIFGSCKKDNEAPDNVPDTRPAIAGKWAGMRADLNQPYDYDFRFTIKADGTLDATNSSGAVKGTGHWTLNGTIFEAHYQFKAPLLTTYSIKGSYDKTLNKITGTWDFDDNDVAGNFYLEKK